MELGLIGLQIAIDDNRPNSTNLYMSRNYV